MAQPISSLSFLPFFSSSFPGLGPKPIFFFLLTLGLYGPIHFYWVADPIGSQSGPLTRGAWLGLKPSSHRCSATLRRSPPPLRRASSGHRLDGKRRPFTPLEPIYLFPALDLSKSIPNSTTIKKTEIKNKRGEACSPPPFSRSGVGKKTGTTSPFHHFNPTTKTTHNHTTNHTISKKKYERTCSDLRLPSSFGSFEPYSHNPIGEKMG